MAAEAPVEPVTVPPVPREMRPVWRVVVWPLTFLGLAGYLWLFRATYIDDAYITLQYARTLAGHLTWGFYPGFPSNTATSPLNVIVLALAGLPFRETADAVTWVTAAELTVILALLLRISRAVIGNAAAGLVAFAALAANPLLLSAMGLEGHLFTLLLLSAVDLCCGGRWLPLAGVLGLLVLARPDGALLVVLLLLLAPVGVGTRARMTGVLALTLLPWVLFSWIVLGSVLPDTLLIKVDQSAWGRTTFANGLGLYLDAYPAATIASLLLVPFAPLVVPALRRAPRRAPGPRSPKRPPVGSIHPRRARSRPRGCRRAFAALASYGVVHYAAYAALGVPPYHWYYTHQVVPAVVCGAFGLAWLVERRAGTAAAYRLAAVPVIALAFVLPVNGLREAPIHTNWGRPGDYRAVGEELARLISPSEVVELRGEIGTLAYYSDRVLIDLFADPAQVDEGVRELMDGMPPALVPVAELNFRWRETPRFGEPAYLVNLIREPRKTVIRETSAPVATWDVSSAWVPHTRIFLFRGDGMDGATVGP